MSILRPHIGTGLAGWWILSALPLVAAPPVPSARDAAAFRQTVEPFLARHCVGCHNEKLRSGEVDLAALREVQRAFHERQVWEQALRKIRTGEMPPPGSPRPPEASVAAVTRWIEELMERQDRALKPDPGRVTARRLNRPEYNNTVRDLLGVDLDPAADFPADDSGYGFDNIGDVLSLSPVLMEKYLAAAERIVRAAIDLPRKVQPTMERYQSPRTRRTKDTVGGRMLIYSPRGAAEVRHRFAFDGEYEMRIQVGDRRKDGSPPIRYVLTLNGKPVAEHDVEPGDYKNRIFDYRFTATRGEHTLGGFFPPEALALAEQAREPLKPNQKPPEDGRIVYTDFLEVRGPFRVDEPASRRRLLVCGLTPPEQNRACAQRILGPLARRAFRRPLRPGELDRLLSIYALAREEGEPFDQAIGYAVQAVLVSPHFLFRIEQDPDPRQPDAIRLLNDHELATRLSYFLWSAPPDAALDRAADRGELRELTELERQALRMLRDPKAQALVENFAGQWLHLRNLESVKPDPERFPDFDEGLRVAMQRETELFFAHVVREDRPILDFLDAPYTFVNERLAEHYGFAGVAGDEFRRVDLDGVQRSGLLTHAGILTISSYPTRTSPVIRGKWILENILGAPPPPPPPDVPELKEEEVGNTGSLRQQMEKHRANPVCASCHARMDTIGFGLENYDAIGRWRTHDGNFPVEAGGVLGGKSFGTPAELKGLLRQDASEFARCLTEKMLTYALGRGLTRSDRATVQAVVKDLERNDYKFSTLVLGIVRSMPFRMRRGDGRKT